MLASAVPVGLGNSRVVDSGQCPMVVLVRHPEIFCTSACAAYEKCSLHRVDPAWLLLGLGFLQIQEEM